jgi:hypothetical protein
MRVGPLLGLVDVVGAANLSVLPKVFSEWPYGQLLEKTISAKALAWA